MRDKMGTGAVKNGCARAAVLIVMTGFFGILYPDLCFTRDTCRVVRIAEDGTEYEAEEEGGLYCRLLSAKPDEIIIKSRLWESISSFFGRITKKDQRRYMEQTDIRQAPIGVFDSGIGGLTVMREIMRQIPNEKIIYFGDTARVPYGNKSRETVTRFSRQIVRFLQAHDVKTIVVACNTASAYALDELKKEIDIPIIGVVEPGAKAAAETTRNGRIGVIATEATIGSRIYSEYIEQKKPDVTIWGKACPLFVPLVEEGLLEDPVTDEIARRYLAELIDLDIDTLILGCTHYPLIRSTVEKVMGEGVTLVNPAYETARTLREMLKEKGLLSVQEPELGCNRYQFYVSDTADKFIRFANSIIKYGILSAKQVNIEEY